MRDVALLAGQLLEHLRAGTSQKEVADLRLPTTYYTCPERARAERAVFARVPLIAAISSSLPVPGSFVTRDLLGVPLLFVRQDDGSLACMLNVCRHRAARVEQERAGRRVKFACVYHGWSYGRDGSLRGVPFEEGFETVDRSCEGLVRVPVEERHGFVWVRLAGDGPVDVAGYLGAEMDEQLAAFGVRDWRVHLDETFEERSNWKLIADGLLDVLHPKFLHPQTVGKLIQSNTHVWERYGRHGRLAMARGKLGEIRDQDLSGVDLRRYVITNFFVYPNTMFVMQPKHFELWNVFPDALRPDVSHTRIVYLVHPSHVDDEEALAPVRQSWEILRHAVTTEDWPTARTIQVSAEATSPGSVLPRGADVTYGRYEVPAQHLHRRLAEDLESVRVQDRTREEAP